MRKILDILCLLVLGANALVFFPTVWLGLAPEQSLSEFLKGWEAYAAFGMMVSVPLVIASYLVGTDVKNQLLRWTRETVLVPCFATARRSFTTLIVVSLLLGAQVGFILGFFGNPAPQFTRLLFEVDAADAQTYAELHTPIGRADGFYWEVSEAAIQADLRTSRHENPETVRILLERLGQRRMIFTRGIHRYLLAYARMKASIALGSLQDALAESLTMEKIGHQLGEEEETRAIQARGQVYLLDREDTLFERKPKASLSAAIKIFQPDRSTLAQRNLGNCYFLNGQPEEAISVWEAALAAPRLTDAVDKKRLLNNLALAYSVLKQHTAAQKRVDEGIALAFDATQERERREQVRLLATKAAICLDLKNIPAAKAAWNQRETLKVDQGSACTFALQAQLLAHECLSEPKPLRKIWLRTQLWYALAGAADLKPAELELDTAEARTKLADTAASKFTTCYRGLTFDSAAVKKAMSDD